MAAPVRQLRFKVGDRVIANTDDGTCAGTVVKLHYREPDWPEVRLKENRVIATVIQPLRAP